MAETPKKVMDIATGIGLWAIESNQSLPVILTRSHYS
jgi:ubiquinone/menaquinone biosynthesis C-methylase UbiE